MADGLIDLPIAVDMLEAAQSSGLDLRAALSGNDEQLRPDRNRATGAPLR